MKVRIMLFLLTLSLFVSGCTTNTNNEIKSDANFNVTKATRNYNENIIKPINKTGYDVLSYLNNENNDKNILFSPLSLTTALSMLENGAKEVTQKEILNFLNLKNDEGVNKTYNQLINHFYEISDNENVENRKTTFINMANSFWFKNYNLKIRKDYIDEIKSSYDGDIYAVDFSNENTKDTMNEWIENKTNGLLKNTIKKTDSLDIAYLINTLYFKGQWLHEFNENNTKKKDFYVNNDLKETVDMMNGEEERNYFESEEVQIVELNYSDASMYVFLPKNDLNDFINENDSIKLNELIKKTNSNKVDLSFPKFKFTNNNDLVDLLKSFGIKSAFDYKLSNFDYMIESGNEIAITKAFQNTAIEVDEKGTEAAAVTVIGMAKLAAKPMNETIIMNCNKPFLFIIKDRDSNVDLFSGILRNPNEK
ncbi:serpin family protein [Clostridiaceae bacterium HSG29]|nr:serpin family protein [Clostridiaceae bacterium HSG29]